MYSGVLPSIAQADGYHTNLTPLLQWQSVMKARVTHKVVPLARKASKDVHRTVVPLRQSKVVRTKAAHNAKIHKLANQVAK